MTKLKTLAVAVALAIATPAFAQFTTGGGSSSMSTSGDEVKSGYNFLGVSYVNTTIMPKHGDDMGMNGFGVKFIHGFSISQTRPMYIETGVNFTMGFDSDSEEIYDDEDLTVTSTLGSLAVPVNFAYRFGLANNIAIKPYAGLNLKFNVIGKTTASYDDESESVSWFKKDTMNANRFQLGWHIGAGVEFSKFYLGLQYGTDFMEFAKKVSTGTFELTLGYAF